MLPAAKRTRIASLDCIVVDGGPEPSVAVVICHGYGASYDDLAPLSMEWMEVLGDRSPAFRFVFPDAPHSLADYGMPDARAWWPINMERLAAAVEASRFDELHSHEPPGIDEVRQRLGETIQKVTEELGGKETAVVLGGFSQGAMLTMDVSLRGEIPAPQRLFQFSGTLVCQPQWEQALRSGRLGRTPVFQSHGTLDPILPFSSAQALRDLLQVAGVQVDFHSFAGPHTIDLESITRTAAALGELVTT